MAWPKLTSNGRFEEKEKALLNHLSSQPPSEPCQGLDGAHSDVIRKILCNLDHYEDVYNLTLAAKKFNTAFRSMPDVVKAVKEQFQSELNGFLRSTIETPPHNQYGSQLFREALIREVLGLDTFEGYKAFVTGVGSLRILLSSGQMNRSLVPFDAKVTPYLAMEHLDAVNLSFSKLRQIPKFICFAGNSVERLYLNGNLLTGLRPEIGFCRILVRLHLQHNQLTQLPNEIGQLKSLEILFLSCNLFEKFPAEILPLTHLKELHLSTNKIKKIPDEITKLRGLKALYIDDNPLEGLPDSIMRFRKLKLGRYQLLYPILTTEQREWLDSMNQGRFCAIM